ncbi:hypothetical protein BM1_00656 [Bipolaris maydis]|nr:hypothetical protein BM1_00656 [Bipolaris maydis]
MEQHERLRWVDYLKQCDYHLRKREETRNNEDDCCHINLWHNECQFHREQRRNARKVDDYYYSTISAEECNAKNLHYAAKEGEGYFPKQRKGSPKTTLKEVRELGAQDLRLQATVLIDGHEVTALIDSGAARTVISPQVVEKNNIPYQTKKVPMRVVLADDSPTIYGNGWIRLETEAKLDNLRVGPFEILEKIGLVNYKLRLLLGIKVHPIFHKKLLEPAPQDAELVEDIKLENDKYMVEAVKDLRKIGRLV